MLTKIKTLSVPKINSGTSIVTIDNNKRDCDKVKNAKMCKLLLYGKHKSNSKC